MSDQTGDFTERFGQRLKEVRVARGLSQEELAHASGLHRTHVSLIERNRRSVRLATVVRLARALHVEPASLIPTLEEIASVHPRQGLEETRTGIQRLDQLFPSIRLYQELASVHGILDIFQDNGGKLLQSLLILNLTYLGRREGNDARDEDGYEYELKTVNIDLTQSFSTHHHLNPVILEKYRKVKAWYFSIYRSMELVEIYRMAPVSLEHAYFSKWEKKWRDSGGRDINNPKIPVSFVRVNGERVYRTSDADR